MKKFEEWVNELASSSVPMIRVLTEEAAAEREDFIEYGRGCACHTGCAPCTHCTHPGNPMNQDEDDSAWRMVPEDEAP